MQIVLKSLGTKGSFPITIKVHFVVQKNSKTQMHIFFDKISLTKIKTRKSFKKGSENSQICHGKPTKTTQIQFLID